MLSIDLFSRLGRGNGALPSGEIAALDVDGHDQRERIVSVGRQAYRIKRLDALDARWTRPGIAVSMRSWLTCGTTL